MQARRHGTSAPDGTGIVTEEQVQKGYVWMNEVNNNIFDTTYEEIADYFGVEGKFVKEEYSDHMKSKPALLQVDLQGQRKPLYLCQFRGKGTECFHGQRVQHERLLRQ